MRKTILTAIAVIAIMVTFACLVWAQDPPVVKMEGSVAKFPEKNISDQDLSQIKLGQGLENIPPEFKFLAGKWWRGQYQKTSSDGGSRRGATWYMFPISYSKETLVFFVIAAETNRGNPFPLVCSKEDNQFKCLVRAATKGSEMSFWKLALYLKNGSPVFEFVEGASGFKADFKEAGVLPNKVFRK